MSENRLTNKGFTKTNQRIIKRDDLKNTKYKFSSQFLWQNNLTVIVYGDDYINEF
jgi:hypothetical protein